MCVAKRPKTPPPVAAPAPDVTADTVESVGVETDEGKLRKKRRSRNSLRIDANITGDGGAGGNGLNIPR